MESFYFSPLKPILSFRGVCRTVIVLVLAFCGSSNIAFAQSSYQQYNNLFQNTQLSYDEGTNTTTVTNLPVNMNPTYNAANKVEYRTVTMTGNGATSNPYLIGTVDQWNAFAWIVDDVYGKNGSCAKLIADITFTNNHSQPGKQSGSGIGRRGSANYCGTFDGQGHTITLNYSPNAEFGVLQNGSDTKNWGGLFFYVGAATIKNLHVTGTIRCGHIRCGTIAHNVNAGSNSTCSIINCLSTVEIIASNVSWSPIGGFVGQKYSSGTLLFSNCFANGRFTVDMGSATAGNICGFVGSNEGQIVSINNSYALPQSIQESGDNIEQYHTQFYPFSFPYNNNTSYYPTVSNSFYKVPSGYEHVVNNVTNQGTDKEAPGTAPSPTTKEETVTALNTNLSTSAWELHNDRIYLKTFAKYVHIDDHVYGEDDGLYVVGNNGNGTVTYQYKVQGAAGNTYATYTPGTTVLNVGNYTLKASVAANNGWDAWESTMDFSVSQREAIISWPNTELTYNGTAQKPTATVSNIVGEDECIVTVSVEGEHTDASTSAYTATATALSNANYKLPTADEDKQTSFTIGKAPLTVKANNHTITYGETGANAGVTYTGFVNGETETTADLSGTLSYTYPKYTNGSLDGSYSVGSPVSDENTNYKITPSGLSSGNYSISCEDGTLTVVKKTLTVTAEPKTITYGEAGANAGVTYNGFVNGETETTADLSGTLSFVYSSDTGGAYKAGDDVGNGYKIEPSGLTSNNYAIEFVAGTLTIEPMALTITANDQTIEFGTEIAKGTDQVTLNPDLFDDDVLTEITLTPSTEDFTDDGTATIMPDVAVIERDGETKTSNYDITYKPGILKTAKSVVGGVPYVTGLFYDASWKTNTDESVFLPLSYTTGSNTVELTKLLGVPKGKPVIFGNATEDPANPDLSDLFYLLSVPDASDDPTEVTAARILTDYNDAVEAMDKQHFAITDGTKTLRQVIEGALGETVPVSDAIVMTLTGGTFRSVYISDSDLDKLARNGLLLFILSKWEYMQVGKDSNPGGGSGLARRISIGDGKTNGIVSLPADNASTDDDWYTLDGRKVNQAPKAKGIYIRRGQKVVVR